MASQEKIGRKFSIPANISIDVQRCFSCGLCREVCPYDLPQPDDYGLYKITQIELCVECGACANNCPVSAITLKGQEGCGCIWCDSTPSDDEKSSCC